MALSRPCKLPCTRVLLRLEGHGKACVLAARVAPGPVLKHGLRAGTLPVALSKCQYLDYLDMHFNGLKGALPACVHPSNTPSGCQAQY